MKTYTFGYSKHLHEVWFHIEWHFSPHDTAHKYYWQPTLGI